MRICRYCKEPIDDGQGIPGPYCDATHKWQDTHRGQDTVPVNGHRIDPMPPRPGIRSSGLYHGQSPRSRH